MSLDTSLRKVASSVLNKLGTAAILRHVTGSGYDTATGVATSSTTDVTVKGRLDDYLDREFSDRIQRGDRKFMIAASDVIFPPVAGDEVLIGGQSFRVIDPVRIEWVQEQAAVYVLQIRH